MRHTCLPNGPDRSTLLSTRRMPRSACHFGLLCLNLAYSACRRQRPPCPYTCWACTQRTFLSPPTSPSHHCRLWGRTCIHPYLRWCILVGKLLGRSDHHQQHRHSYSRAELAHCCRFGPHRREESPRPIHHSRCTSTRPSHQNSPLGTRQCTSGPGTIRRGSPRPGWCQASPLGTA